MTLKMNYPGSTPNALVQLRPVSLLLMLLGSVASAQDTAQPGTQKTGQRLGEVAGCDLENFSASDRAKWQQLRLHTAFNGLFLHVTPVMHPKGATFASLLHVGGNSGDCERVLGIQVLLQQVQASAFEGWGMLHGGMMRMMTHTSKV